MGKEQENYHSIEIGTQNGMILFPQTMGLVCCFAAHGGTKQQSIFIAFKTFA